MRNMGTMNTAQSYRDQDSGLTLAEGLDQYRRENPELVDPTTVSPGAAAFYRGHDVCHVVFGCGTAPNEEALADAWTLLGTDVTLRQFYSFLRLPEHQDLVAQVGIVGACSAAAKACPQLLALLWQSRRMTKKWPWRDHAQYLNRPLGDIRREFGIHILL